MEETSTPSTPKKRGRPPKKSVEVNTTAQQESHESCSFKSSASLSNWYFGLNIFDGYSPEQIQNLVKDPMANNQQLRELSLILYGTNGTFSNTVDYSVALPTLDRVVITHGSNKTKKQKNKELMVSTLRIIKDKEIIRDALFKGMVEGLAFYYFETTERPFSNKKFMSDYDVNKIGRAHV